MAQPLSRKMQTLYSLQGVPGGSDGKEPAFNARRPGFDRVEDSVGKIRWKREWLPTPVFLPGEFHG